MNRILLSESKNNTTVSFSEHPGVDYVINKEIGRGASCVVYHAVGSDNTEHLLKEYYPKYLELIRDGSGNIVVPEDKKELFEQGLTRFRTGCDRQKNIRLSNEDLKNFTCNVQGYYAANGTEYIDMTCFNGRTYDHVQEKSVYDLMLRMRTLAQVIGNYHKAGLLHLDIKPENIYVRPEGETIEDVMLFDFDSVTPMNEIAVSKALSCTKTWAAPEQLLPEKRRRICPATDLFAIGEIIFVQLFGRHSTSAERRSFVSKYAYDHNADIFKDMNPKVFSLLDDLLCHTICGVVDKRYQSAEELSAKLDEIIKIANPEVPYLQSSLPAVQDFFIGRENEIAEIHHLLRENCILFLNGIGGIGKSELAKHYAKEYKDDYDAIIFAPYVSDVNMLLQDDTAIPLYNFSRYPEEKPEEYCARKLRKLQELCDERTLFIVDNLDREDDPDLNKLLDLGCKLLITTRMDFSDYGYGQQLYLDALENRNKINELFLHHYIKPLSAGEQNCVAQIIDIVGGHTMTVELLAKQMMAGRVKPDKMLAKLQEGGISESGKEKVRSGKDGVLSAQSTYGHIQALFDLSGLDEGERYILANLSLIPHTGISVELFHDWCELEDYDGINRLVVEGWVRLDKEKDYVSLHPVVSDICQVSCQELNLISTLIEKIYVFLLNKDYYAVTEVSTYIPIFLNIANVLSSKKYESEIIARLYHNIGIFFQSNTGYIEFAENIMEKGLLWYINNITDNDTLRLSISYYLSILRTNKALFGNHNHRVERLNNWYSIYKAKCNSPIHNDEMSVEERISILSSIADHFSNLLDNENNHIYNQQIVDEFEKLSISKIDAILLSENGCDIICDVASAYESLEMSEKAIILYDRIIDSINATPSTLEIAYLGIIYAKMDNEEWNDGLILCDKYYQFLNTYYQSGHKAFLLYYEFHLCCLIDSIDLDALDECKILLPQKLLEVINVFWKYKELNDQLYGEFTTINNHTVDEYAHIICEGVLFYLEITAKDYEGQEISSEMDYKIVYDLLSEAKTLFCLMENPEGVCEVERYLNYIKEKID